MRLLLWYDVLIVGGYMKRRSKYLFFLFLLLLGFFYTQFSNLEQDNDVTKDEPAVNSTGDAVQLNVNGNLNIYFLDVGQADAILLENNKEYMLIDAGNNADGKKLVSYFKSLGIDEFKYVVASHAHEDHIGGMDDIINNFKVQNFYMPDVVTTTKTFEDLLEALENNGVGVTTPEAFSKFSFSDCEFIVLHAGSESDDLNDSSIVLRLIYVNNSFLFMGDATSKVEKKLLSQNINSDVLKVGHHGSQYSTTDEFLNKVRSKYAIISSGLGNSYGHPNSKTLDKLNGLNVKIYRTDTEGTIVLSSDGNNISFKSLKTDLNG